jgi:peroxiredoxin
VSEEGRSPGPGGEDAPADPSPPADPRAPGERGAPAERGAADQPRRLDPEAAAQAAARRATRRSPQPVVDTRRYQRMIGLFGLLLVVVISISFLTTHGPGTAGIPAGKKLHYFAAPLALSTLNGDANTNPPCTLSKHDPRALNICLINKRTPVVLAFFVTNSSGCQQQVTALQKVSRRYNASQVQFAAVAVRTGHSDARKAVRTHHWTVPVAYDADGAVGDIYGVEVCPIVELAYRGGVVARRLIGQHWASAATLTPQVQALLRGQARR